MEVRPVHGSSEWHEREAGLLVRLRNVAQFGSAPDLGSGGRRFKSCHSDGRVSRCKRTEDPIASGDSDRGWASPQMSDGHITCRFAAQLSWQSIRLLTGGSRVRSPGAAHRGPSTRAGKHGAIRSIDLLRSVTSGGTLPALGVTFEDYQDQVYARISAGDQEKSQDYWRARLANLPDAPRLPLAKEPNQLSRPRFVRRKSVLPREQWQKLTDKARGLGVTPSCLLLNSYASVLASWSENPALSINVTLFDRRQVHADIHHIMGDFTSLLLLETVQHESNPG